MPVRCPACHSDQTKPAPARNLWEQLSGLWGRRAYFCEDCYRRFIPSGANQDKTDQPAEAPASQAPGLAQEEITEVSMAIPAQEGPAAQAHAPEPPPSGPADLEDEESLISRMRRQMPEETPAAPEDEESLISRMRRQLAEEEPLAPAEGNAQDHQVAQAEQAVEEAPVAAPPAAPPAEPGLSRWFSPLRLAMIGGGVVAAMVLVLWYRSSLERPPQVSQPPTTRVKISETPLSEPPATPAPAAPAAITPTPLPPPAAQAPAGPTLAPAEKPAPRAAEPLRPEPKPRETPRPSARPPAPSPPKPAAKAPPGKPVAATAAKTPAGPYAVQFGAFSQPARAQALAAKLQAKGLQVQVLVSKGSDGKTWHKVRSAGLPSQAEAQRVQQKMEQVSGVKGMVVRYTP